MYILRMEKPEFFPWIDGIETREWDFEMALREMTTLKDEMLGQLCKTGDVWNEETFKDAGDMC